MMSTNGADYNIFGYDPDGRIASLAAFFYGPAWKPVNHNPIPPCVQLEGAPPRYGPPAPEQLPFLSPNFIPRLPPCYLGSPDPPYRAGSETFTRGNFAAVLLRSIEDQVPWELGSDLEKQYGRRILDGLPIGEVKDGVFWVPVYSVLESKADRVEFGIMSDISWWSFREMVCKHMGVEPTRAKLAYRLYVEGHAEVDPKGMIDATDLDQVMKEVGRRFEHCNDVEIELMNINNSSKVAEFGNGFEAQARRMLSSRAPSIETYAFAYPSLDSFMKNFAAIEPKDTQRIRIVAGIEPEKILALYFWAREMIALIHEENSELIVDLKALRSLSQLD